MKRILLVLLTFTATFAGVRAQVGIGTTNPDASSALHVSSSSKGLLIPQMTQAQRNAIASPATGLLVFQTDNTTGFYYNTGTPAAPSWVSLGVIFAGDGVATTASRSDHDHVGQVWTGGNSATLNTTVLTLQTNATDHPSSALYAKVADPTSNAVAIFGETFAAINDGVSAAVEGQASGNSSFANFALYGRAKGTNSCAVFGEQLGAGSMAGVFHGDVSISGTLSKSAGTFKIDHPLDPENKYLSHSFVESPDMMNIYNGNIVLDGNGEATVTMPDWFEALNKDFRYQLTAIGKPSPNLYIAGKISGNQFRIAGGTPGAEVSWTVTGIRHDAYANAHRTPVEQAKPAAERGKYLTPEVYGQPATKALYYHAPRAATAKAPATSSQPAAGQPQGSAQPVQSSSTAQ